MKDRDFVDGQGYCEKHKSTHTLINDGFGGCMLCKLEQQLAVERGETQLVLDADEYQFNKKVEELEQEIKKLEDIETVATDLLQLHDEQVFICGSDDERTVARVLNSLRKALKKRT